MLATARFPQNRVPPSRAVASTRPYARGKRSRELNSIDVYGARVADQIRADGPAVVEAGIVADNVDHPVAAELPSQIIEMGDE